MGVPLVAFYDTLGIWRTYSRLKPPAYSRGKYTEDDIINMLELLVDNIFVVFGGKVFQQIVGTVIILFYLLYITAIQNMNLKYYSIF